MEEVKKVGVVEHGELIFTLNCVVVRDQEANSRGAIMRLGDQ